MDSGGSRKIQKWIAREHPKGQGASKMPGGKSALGFLVKAGNLM